MLTRIEIDGFKTFDQFALDLSPFAVVVGPNAVGKSNLFDVIQLLSKLAAEDLRQSFSGRRGEADDLFRRDASGKLADRMKLAVEVLVDPTIEDPWGKHVELVQTRMRYELVIERRRLDRGLDRLFVVHERAVPLRASEDKWQPFDGKPSRDFRSCYLHYRRQSPLLETRQEGSRATFRIFQDGHAGRSRPAEAPEATVLSSMRAAEFPHLFALREEMLSWRFLQLDPASLRKPSPRTAPEELLPDGSNVAAVLARIEAETRTNDRPRGALADIAAQLSSLVPGVLDLDVQLDESLREYRARVRLRDEPWLPTTVISDGTLRLLALLTLLNDPRHRGLVCYEEPENGIHPAQLKALIRRLREMVTDPTESTSFELGAVDEVAEPGTSEVEPLTQLLMNSHSPVVLAALQADPPSQVLFVDVVDRVDPSSRRISHRTRMRQVRRQGDLTPEETRDLVSAFEVERYLDTAKSGELV